jgi:NAD(P) transhydrogenase
MSADSFDYDLLVIGSGPAGQRAAIQGAKLEKNVAVVERKTVIGACSVNNLEIIGGNEHGTRVRLHLDSGKTIIAEKALYSVGRTGATASLNLAAAGLVPDNRGRLAVDGNYQSQVPNIYAVGDMIGFPALASTSMEQGRLAVCHAFGVKTYSRSEHFPYGIYAVPEISMVGKNEEELTEASIPYEIGKARYKEIARGQILGDVTGLLKLIFHAETRELLGVHIIGEGASELIHIGQAVLSFGGKIDYFIDTVFNYPTLAECYKVAAFDGINRLGIFEDERTETLEQPDERDVGPRPLSASDGG